MSKPAAASVRAALVLTGAILALAAAAARADEPPPGPTWSPIRKPAVVATSRVAGPSAADMANYYPDLAARMKRSGDVMLHCMIAPAGVLTGCIVTAETPPDLGFGAAAIRLTSKFKYAPLANPTPHDIHIRFVPPS
jgi:TonB family protein